MRIASYNIRKAVGLDWRRDPGRVVDVLAEIGADIVVLQEADKRVGRRAGVLPPERLLGELHYHVADVAVRPDSHGWHGNVILYRHDHGLTDTHRLNLPTFEPRGAVVAQFSNPDLQVVGVHLGLVPSVRTRQIEALARYVASTSGPVILAGDFNERKELKAFAGGYTVVTPGPTYHTSRPAAHLDRFVLSGPVAHVKSWVHSSALAQRASDHLPIVMDIELKE